MLPNWNRQALLALAFTAMLATAGCTGVLDGGDASGSAQMDSVPADAQMVGYADLDGMLADDSLRALTNTMLRMQAENGMGTGPENVTALLERAEEESSLDFSQMNDVTFFSSEASTSVSGTSDTAMILTADWSEDDLVSAMEESGTEVSETTYEDTTVYTYGFEDQNALAVLGDGTFAFGGQAAVETVVDVRAGNADALSGDLLAAYQDTRDGYLRFAVDVPQQEIPADQIGTGTQLNTSAFNTVQFVAGTFYTSGDQVGTDLRLTSDSESSAERTYDVLNGALSLYSGMVEDEMRENLDRVSVSQDGDTVTVNYENAVENLEELVENASSVTAGSASASGSASSSNSTSSSSSMTDSASDSNSALAGPTAAVPA